MPVLDELAAARESRGVKSQAIPKYWLRAFMSSSFGFFRTARNCTLVFSVACAIFVHAAEPGAESCVSPATMQQIYEQAKTPFKYGIVLRGNQEEKVDCPNVFRHGPRWYMIYIAFDGSGYETRIAESRDLISWTPKGAILKRTGAGWDAEQAAAGIALIDPRWNGSWKLKKYEGRYWLSYLGGKHKGYETPPLSIGLAWTKDPARASEWTRLAENPVLSPGDLSARDFERDTLFKSHILRDPDRSLGSQFVMFYNARKPGDSERIGIAVSDDLRKWRRYGDEHVLENVRSGGGSGGVISGDPQIVCMDGIWVMFYFGAFWKPGAFDTFAASHDLVHWTKWTGPDLVAPSEPWDKEYAHKPWIIRHRGVVYHFYCAVGDEGRVIAVATSKDLRQKP